MLTGLGGGEAETMPNRWAGVNFQTTVPSERGQTERTILCDSIYMKFEERRSYHDTEQISVAWVWQSGKGIHFKETQGKVFKSGKCFVIY